MKLMIPRTLLSFLIFLTFFRCFSQTKEQQKIIEFEKAQEVERQQKALQAMDSAIVMMNNEKYEEADARFKFTLKMVKTVPSELAYYFGENSFHLKKYKQSIDWLTKYIQLKGTTGKFSDDAIIYLKKSEEALLNELNQQKSEAIMVLSKDFDIDCGPSGKVVCPVCNGKTVIIKKTYIGETYKTCPYCDKHGFLSCDHYNKLLRGQLKLVE